MCRFPNIGPVTEAEYSRLVLDFFMAREPGYYLLDYYIPSGFLVIVSWVSFWLSPEAAPARVTLGQSPPRPWLEKPGWTGRDFPSGPQ